MAKLIEPKTKRNEEIKKDYLDGKLSMTEMVVKYDISSTRIHVLLKKMGVKPNRQPKSGNRKAL